MVKKKNKIPAFLLIIIIGFSLRPSITGFGSLLKVIKPDLGLSDTAAGFISTVSMLSFAVFSPLVNKISSKWNSSKTLGLGFSLIVMGILVRSYLGIAGVFAGTFIIGCGIACGNVLIPAVIKESFPKQFGFYIAVNSTVMAISSGVASGINYPAATRIGWQNGLCIWAIPAVLSVFASLSLKPIASTKKKAVSQELFHNKLAWSVTLFSGIECLLFYSCTSWLATIFIYKGLDAAKAGLYVSAFQLMGIVSSFIVPYFAGKKKDQRRITGIILAIMAAGFLLMMLTDNQAFLLIGNLMAGFACNGAFALSIAFLGFRASDSEKTAQLSGMSQSVGYLIAAFGPIGMGVINDVFHNWNINLFLMAVLSILLFIISRQCAKDEEI